MTKEFSVAEQSLLSYLEKNNFKDAAVLYKADPTTLDLSNSKICDIKAQGLTEALKDNNTLTILNLSFNNIGEVGAKSLGKALEYNRTLISFDLSYNHIGDVGAESLGKALKYNKTLISLNLPHNDIGEVGAKSLGEALKDNKTLISLDLSINMINEVGAKSIGEALKDNKTLISLNLLSNMINEVGAKSLGKVLEYNKTLISFDLSYSCIGEVGVKDLAKALKDNHILATLGLGGNGIRPETTKELVEALENNYTITDIGGIEDYYPELKSLIVRNKEIFDNSSDFVLDHFDDENKPLVNIDSDYFKNPSYAGKTNSELCYKNLKAFQKIGKLSFKERYISKVNNYNKYLSVSNKVFESNVGFNSLVHKVNKYIDDNFLQLKGVCKSIIYKSTEDNIVEGKKVEIEYKPALLVLPKSLLSDIFSMIELSLWSNKPNLQDDAVPQDDAAPQDDMIENDTAVLGGFEEL